MRQLGKLPVYAFVGVVSAFSLLPFYIMLIMGTYFSEDLYTGIKIWPGTYLLENFRTVVNHDFFSFYKNSLTVSIVHTVFAVFISALTGFAFAKYKFKGKHFFYFFILGTMMIPPQLGMIGFVVEMRWLGLSNTLVPLILSGIASSFGTFWMTQYISTAVPDEIIESGRLDGCSSFGIFARIVLPVIRPAIITLFLLLFLWSWNDYMTPLVVINKKELYTIPLAISLISSEYRTDYAARILALSMSTIPIIIIFALGSKHLIRGLVSGSVKG